MNWLVDNKVFDLFSDEMRAKFIANGMVSEKYVFELFKKIRFGICGCANCGIDFYTLEDNRFKCKNCYHHFSLTSGTYLEGTKIPLHKWWRIVWWVVDMRLNKGSRLIARDCELSQRTAWLNLSVIHSSIGMVNAPPSDKIIIFNRLLTPHIKEKFPELLESKQHLLTLKKLIYLKTHYGTTN